MTELRAILAAIVLFCCQRAVTQESPSAIRETLDRTTKGQVEAMARTPEPPKAPERNLELFAFEAGVVLLAVMFFRNYAARIGGFLSERFAARSALAERSPADDQSVASYAASLPSDRGFDDFESALSPEEARKAHELATALIERAGPDIEAMRYQIGQIIQAEDLRARQAALEWMYMNVRSVSLDARAAGLTAHFRLALALQHLIGKFIERPERISVSGLETAKITLDLLKDLCVSGQNYDLFRQPIRVLVVDDDATVRHAFALAVQMGLERPHVADCGEAAVDLARERAFDVVFMDVLMPGIDGFAACRQIRETPLNEETPVVFITSHTQPFCREEASAAGGCGFIPKPALTSEVGLAAVTFALRGRLEKVSPRSSCAGLATPGDLPDEEVCSLRTACE